MFVLSTPVEPLFVAENSYSSESLSLPANLVIKESLASMIKIPFPLQSKYLHSETR